MSSNAFVDRGWIRMKSGAFRPSPRPRGGDWLLGDLRLWAEDGVGLVVSMLTALEVQELGLGSESKHCQRLNIEFKQFPILDRDVPTDREAFLNFASDVSERIGAGCTAVFHCRAGLGRAPLLGCAVLIREGFAIDEAWRLLEQCRRQKVPDTLEQRAWLLQPTLSFEEALRSLAD